MDENMDFTQRRRRPLSLTGNSHESERKGTLNMCTLITLNASLRTRTHEVLALVELSF